MTTYVVDASTAVKLYLIEPLAAEAAALFALLTAGTPADFHVPDLFFVECANIFWKQARKGTVTAAQVAAFETKLRALPLARTPTFELTVSALPIALAHDITAYDACYVALAQRLGVPLITADQKLQAKLAGTPYAVVWLGAWTPPVP
jgi:predicted nucleic acid-binding protein